MPKAPAMSKTRLLLIVLLLIGIIAAALSTHLMDPRSREALGYLLKLSQSFSHFASAPPAAEHTLAPLLGNVYTRRSTSLNGQWRYLVDQRGDGDTSVLYRGGIGQDRQAKSRAQMFESDFSNADFINVPSDWNTQQQKLFWYQGVVWYQRSFAYSPAQPGERSYLYIGAANQHADVYLNGHLLARHSGGFTPFNIDVSDYLQAENRLIIKVDSRGTIQDIPGTVKDWMDYGGLTRDVLLVHVPQTHIENYKIQLAAGQTDRVSGWIQLRGESFPAEALVRIPELDIEQRVAIDDHGYAKVAFALQAQLWSPETPKLYRVEISAGEETLLDDIGFRAISRRGSQILLNGEPIFLRGAAVHETWLDRPGRAQGPDHAEALMQRLKHLNANYVRLAHYPHDEHTLRAADRHGLLVWSEIPVFNKIDFANDATLANGLQQLEAMILRDHNRASIMFWSIGNETPDTGARNHFMAALAERARQLDDSRLVSAAIEMSGALQSVGKFLLAQLSGYQPEPAVISLHDELAEYVDVIGYNEYLGWYGSGFLADILEVDEARLREIIADNMASFRLDTPYDKPLLISEFGAGAKLGLRGSKRDVWTEDYQDNIYQQQFTLMANSPALRGVSAWNLKDFHSPSRLNSRSQGYFNRKGLLSELGEPKQSYFSLRQFYQQLAAEPALNPAALAEKSAEVAIIQP